MEQAAESAQIAATTRHARFFTKQSGVLERVPRNLGIQALHGPRAQERDNLRQALKWSAETGDADKMVTG